MAVEREELTRLPDLEYLRGLTVITADGHRLGLVRDTHGSYLEVDASRQRDFWLASEHISSIAPPVVTVCFNKGELDDYKLERPGLEPAEDPFREIVQDGIISADEQLDQRARMERELAEQRRHLPHAHPQGEQSPPDTLSAMGTVGEPVETELPRLVGQLAEQPHPHRLAPEPIAGSYTGAIVPSADRVPETVNMPITEQTTEADARVGSMFAAARETAPQTRAGLQAPEYDRRYDDVEEPSGFNVRSFFAALLGVTGLVAVIAYVRRRPSRRHRSIPRS